MPRTAIMLLLVGLAAQARGADPVDYVKDVKPTLTARCYACHGALQQKAGLRVDTAKAMLDAGAIIAGKSGESPLIAHILGEGDHAKMPPPEEGEALTAVQVKAIRNWIDAGAIAPPQEAGDPDPREHWSFRAPVRPPVPGMDKNPIDAFLNVPRAKKGIAPPTPAERRLLLRRVTLDLTGIPPTAEEYAAFLADTRPDAYERVVDRLLASPRYGERWGRHFMDVWRYSDWWGLGAEVRNSQKHIWHWRDWIIESLNSDVGYDEMARQMFAADELYPTDPAKLRATGFLARQYFKFNRTSWLDETLEHTGKAFLGLTVNCAKCHDHKYDPVSQKAYYQLRAIFEPYQVRTDMVPGELDYEKNGIPRAFDCNLDAPTYKHERGDERRAITTQKIEPGLPPLLSRGEFQPKAKTLPAEAVKPHLRPYVEQNYLAAVEQQLSQANQAVTRAEKDLAAARQRATTAPAPTTTTKAPATKPKPLVHEVFARADKALWAFGAGMWAFDKDGLTQSHPTAERSAVRLKRDIPTDFEARAKFVITGGSPYQSVGICFDVGDGHEAMVYASAGGSKIQVSFRTGGAAHSYTVDGAVTRTIPTGVPHEMTVRVRGTTVNVAWNGEHILAYRLPMARRTGGLDLITYAATVSFREFDLAELPAEAEMIEPKGKTAPNKPLTMEQAQAALILAQRIRDGHVAQKELIQAVFAAERARAADPKSDKTKELISTAARAEKQRALAKAQEELAKLEQELVLAPQAGKAAVQKKVDTARAAVTTAEKAIAKPGESYTVLTGSLKTLESNLENEASRMKPFPATSTGRRTAFAEWLTDRQHPLTARVLVNQVWARRFGRPLVATVFDFGRKGAKPTHPELLDWLAVEFMEHGWSMKHLHRLMVTSQAYQASSRSIPASEAIDPENTTYWRQNPIRLEAQAVRDSLLHLAGQLDTTMGGPSIPAGEQDASRRRSLYFVHSHNDHNKFLSQFDDANVLDCYRRTESIVPQQALTLSNSRFALTMAEAITKSLAKSDDTDAAFITRSFETLLGTTPTKDETAACAEALKAWQEQLRGAKHPNPVAKARQNLVGALLNHNDFITVR